MRLTEKHANGSVIEIQGSSRKVRKTLNEWRKAQALPEPEEEDPIMFGAPTGFPGGSDNSYLAGQSPSRWGGNRSHPPLAIGFAPNPE